ncbi:hypothetical protein glysoja_023721 [Glycine soja]|nr:hypothetical protein glysoja_023721 [Glycine soja]
MIRYGHRNVVAADSTFGAKRLKYPLFTLLVFDSRQHALPVAWVITRSFAKPDVSKWLKALIDQARSVEPGWKLNGFLIDDATAEIDLLPVDDSFALDLSLAWTHQMLDQIQKQVELNNSTDIDTVVNNMPLKWVSKKGRTYIGKPSSLALPHGSSNTKSVGVHKN